MPYVLSPLIRPDAPGLWAEGAPYSVEPIYDLCNPSHPPVRYDAHRLAPHSLPHVDAPSHILEDGADVGSYFTPARLGNLYGPVLLLKLQSPVWQDLAGGRHCLVDAAQLRAEIRRATGSEVAPDKLILSLADLPMTAHGQHDPACALTLAEDAADWLLANPRFDAYLTSWKSTDFQPGSRARPIHRKLLPHAAVFECLDVAAVPEGLYFLSAFPLPLAGASEAPVCPVLFTFDELAAALATR
ncbi:cyclase family protein [uncultured Nevskia sp.]|uniref:cyclase family protein n=1 Tax=uncultured Nevskia sp. TaxID=228950 RepID=UPI0025F50613|nr:cyclase family protein [uncultured Nevskia sp.]